MIQSEKQELELYVHIPFCVKKCAYCDFLSGPATESTVEAYIQALGREILSYESVAKDYEVSTIFFGGGTPSILSGEQVQWIMEQLHRVFAIRTAAEVTLEANPGTVRAEKLAAYYEAGIRRLSFGLQSVKDEELKCLGRIHTYKAFEESYRLAREAGFQNINVDLISAIPMQTLSSWEETLQKVIALHPEHISAYSLIIEEGTPFAAVYGEGGALAYQLPDEETERAIYRRTEQLLSQAGYHRYEISNYAKEGKECKHNLGYWSRVPYLGLGLGASSLMQETRFHNTADLQYYLEHTASRNEICEEREVLTEVEQMEEFVFLGLRKMEGISEEQFLNMFRKSIWDCYGENVERMIQSGLLERVDGFLRLTSNGIDLSNYVFAEILF